MGKTQFININRFISPNFLLTSACLLFSLTAITSNQGAQSIGFISHHTVTKLPSRWQNKTCRSNYRASVSAGSVIKNKLSHSKNKHSNNKTAYSGHFHKHVTNPNANVNQPYQSIRNLIANLQVKELMPGILYKKGTGNIRLNILDIDTNEAPVLIKPIIAPEGSAKLQTVKDHINSSRALAAINANYFKNTGLPLGTLIIDGDWVAGPLYERVALGISKSGFVRIDRVGLGGTLTTSNPKVPQLWINNINTPRRSGCRTIAYSRKWGSSVHLEYDGCLVSIDAQGRVLDSDRRAMTIPYGGIVLSDSKNSAISALQRGDQTYLHWQASPESWNDITQAVSGGPMLLKNNNYCINLKAESFHSNWTSNNIKARTACGVTANNHLILVTAEGSHTLYDLAHVLYELGAVDAMNLDGGGSTTMVIHDATVNMESKSTERKVAVALGIFVMDKKDKSAYAQPCRYIPNKETLDLIGSQPKKPLENQAVAN